jgi:hypothetical protein
MGRPLMPKPDKAETVKTTVVLPAPLWESARIHAIEERTDFRTVVIRALEAYLKASKKGGHK